MSSSVLESGRHPFRGSLLRRRVALGQADPKGSAMRVETMGRQREEMQRSLQSGMKAVAQAETKGEPKIGVEEFMSVAERFGFSEATLAKIREAVEAEEWGAGPFLANYYSNLPQTKVQAFEEAARKGFGVPYAIGVSSGTAALHSAFVAVGVGPGTEVICPAIGFFATAAAVVTSGGVPVFCDVDESLGIDPSKIEALINERTVAIAPTHVMGSVCDMGSVMEVARRHKLRVVEDCAQSCGAKFRGQHVGTIGDMGCFSVSAYKIVGGGEGGLVLTKEERLWERASCLAECGGLWRPDRFAPPRYEGELFCGTSYRMSELEAAVDLVQLQKMPATVARFRAAKRRILSRLKTFREMVPQKLNDPEGEVGYLIRFYPKTFELGEQVVRSLRAAGVSAGMRGKAAGPDWHIYSYMYAIILKAAATEGGFPSEHPLYKQRGGQVEYRRGDCPVADDLFDRMITVSLNQWYSEEDCDRVADAINQVLEQHCTADPQARPWS
jgi:8-amino-3,8-dideoxy-alpha-D-manno-octulosonate transaminase